MVEIVMKTPYDGTPFYCKTCGAGYAEYGSCEEINCQLESVVEAKARQRALLGNEGWNYDMANAPHDRPLIVSTNSVEGLPAFTTHCQWHPDAGFCVCELREVIAWRDFPPPAKEVK